MTENEVELEEALIQLNDTIDKMQDSLEQCLHNAITVYLFFVNQCIFKNFFMVFT